MRGFRPGRYHVLALFVIVITAASLVVLGRALSRIEATLPLVSLHQERDFAAFLLDISRLDAALRVATASPSPEHIDQLAFSLDLAAARSRDNQSLYRDSRVPGLAAFHQEFNRTQQALDAILAHPPVSAEQLVPQLECLGRLRQTLQGLNDQAFQHSMEQASAQQHHLDQLGQALPVLLILFGAFAVGLVYFALRQRRNLQALGSREAQLRESEASYRGLFDNVSEAVYILDDQGCFLDVNRGAEEMYGYRREEMLGQSAELVAAPGRNDLDLAWERQRQALAGTPQQLELWGRRKNGETFLKQVWLNRGRYFGRDVVIAMATDISTRKQVEEELRRSNRELEQFAYAISHDMRQPLRMISSYQQLLERALRDRLDDDTRTYLNFATDGAKRLDQMLVGLLEYSRVGRKTQPLDWIASRETLDEALLFLKPALDEARAEVRVAGTWPTLRASRDELVRLFQNLVGNAVKYRDPERAPVIDVVGGVTGDLAAQRWTVRISDNGIGIDPAQIPRLFQVFQRLQARSRYDGAGVGLALCRKIVEHHGGRIQASSAGEGLGSTFEFELPLSPPRLPGEGDQPPPGP
jgi:PAS domain S-box-containing protein